MPEMIETKTSPRTKGKLLIPESTCRDTLYGLEPDRKVVDHDEEA